MLREKERILIKKNTELQNKIDKLEVGIDELEYQNKKIRKHIILQEDFFDNTY